MIISKLDENFIKKLKETAKENVIKNRKIVLVTKGKTPLYSWKDSEDIIKTADDIERVFSKYEGKITGCALITGEESGITVVDVDNVDLLKKINLPRTRVVKTGRGYHYYYKYCPEAPNGPHSKFSGIDILNGKLIILPNSLHPSGSIYTLLEDIDEFPDFPEELLISDTDRRLREYKASRDMNIKKVYKSERNEIATKVAGWLFKKHKDQFDVWSELEKWNSEMCIPPLEEKELKNVFDSVSKYENEPTEKESNSLKDQFVDYLLSNSDISLFHSDLDEAWIRIKNDNHYEQWPIKSSKVNAWLSYEFWKIFKKAMSGEVVKSVKTILTAKAVYEEKKIDLSIRVAGRDKSVLYDLGNKDWNIIEIDTEGWKVINNDTPVFRRFEASLPQVIPDLNGDIKKVLKYVNIKSKEHELLFLVCLVYFFVPDTSYPIPYFYGPQGSAKSTVGKILRKIIDPSKTDISKFPKNTSDFVQQLSQHHLSVFDNISYINEAQSDDLCRGATGGSLFKRKLYTDDEQIVLEYRRPIIVNGINLSAIKPDLLERCILFELERIDPTNRLDEEQLKRDFKEDLPSILGGCFNVLSESMKIKENNKNKPNSLGRMADFEKWGRSIAVALGYSEEEFVKTVTGNRDSQVYESIIADRIGEALIMFFEKNSEMEIWEGSPTALFDCLNKVIQAEDEGPLDFSSEKVAKNSNAMMRRLNILSTPLKEVGFEVETTRRSSGREVKITRIK